MKALIPATIGIMGLLYGCASTISTLPTVPTVPDKSTTYSTHTTIPTSSNSPKPILDIIVTGHGWSSSPATELGPTFSVGECHVVATASGQVRPDPRCTPGAIDRAVTKENIDQTICKSGYTATVRPPVSITSKFKMKTKIWYGMPTNVAGEYDHLIPLELGGSSDTRNLWVEPGPIPNPKDKVENRLHKMVCAGSLSLIQAQEEIASDWTTAK